MRIRKNDNFHITFFSVVTGLFLGLALLPLTIFISTLPYYAYVARPVLFSLPVLFVLLLIVYLLAAASQRRKKRYAALLFAGIFSVALPFLASLTFTFGYPHVHQTLYMELMELTGLLVNAKRFSMTPVPGHYLICLSSMLPGIITGIILLSAYLNKKRRRDAEYHQPKKKNYYYI